MSSLLSISHSRSQKHSVPEGRGKRCMRLKPSHSRWRKIDTGCLKLVSNSVLRPAQSNNRIHLTCFSPNHVIDLNIQYIQGTHVWIKFVDATYEGRECNDGYLEAARFVHSKNDHDANNTFEGQSLMHFSGSPVGTRGEFWRTWPMQQWRCICCSYWKSSVKLMVTCDGALRFWSHSTINQLAQWAEWGTKQDQTVSHSLRILIPSEDPSVSSRTLRCYSITSRSSSPVNLKTLWALRIGYCPPDWYSHHFGFHFTCNLKKSRW